MSDRDLMRMTESEVEVFLAEGTRAQVATFNNDGSIHLVPMSYFFWDSHLALWTDPSSQKVANIRRDPRVTLLVEGGSSPEDFRAVQIRGRAEVLDNPGDSEKAGLLLFERYSTEPLTDQARQYAQMLASIRATVVIKAERVVSWDHRKLGAARIEDIGS